MCVSVCVRVLRRLSRVSDEVEDLCGFVSHHLSSSLLLSGLRIVLTKL